MKLYRHWHKYHGTVEIDGRATPITCLGGSNVSAADAERAARERADRVQQRIKGQPWPADDYEPEIREQVLASLDDHNLISRNRYGAEVLNSENLLMMDLDHPRLGFWRRWFGRPNLAERKKLMVEQARRQAGRPEYRGLGFRFYETHSGVRVLVTGRDFDPRGTEATAMLQAFHADPLYSLLCRKQACFRARLTPKPYRLKCRGLKVRYPRDEAEERIFDAWRQEYDGARAPYDVCRFLASAGVSHAHRVVEYHDQATGAFGSRKLA